MMKKFKKNLQYIKKHIKFPWNLRKEDRIIR